MKVSYFHRLKMRSFPIKKFRNLKKMLLANNILVVDNFFSVKKKVENIWRGVAGGVVVVRDHVHRSCAPSREK